MDVRWGGIQVARVVSSSSLSPIKLGTTMTPGSTVSVTMLLGTSIAREAKAWRSALLQARDAAERDLLPSKVHSMLASPRSTLERNTKVQLFTDQSSSGNGGNIAEGFTSPSGLNGLPPGPTPLSSKESHGVPRFDTASNAGIPGVPSSVGSVPNSTAHSSLHNVYLRSPHVQPTTTGNLSQSPTYPLPTNSAAQPLQPPTYSIKNDPATPATHHLVLTPDVKELISEVMQHNPEFSTCNDALRAALQMHLESPQAASPGTSLRSPMQAGLPAGPSSQPRTHHLREGVYASTPPTASAYSSNYVYNPNHNPSPLTSTPPVNLTYSRATPPYTPSSSASRHHLLASSSSYVLEGSGSPAYQHALASLTHAASPHQRSSLPAPLNTLRHDGHGDPKADFLSFYRRSREMPAPDGGLPPSFSHAQSSNSESVLPR